MPSGKAPIVEASSVDALLARHRSRRRPVPAGVLALLTVLFWGVWLYLVLPLVSLLLWAFGVSFFVEQFRHGGYQGLRAPLIAYSTVLLVLVSLLALWIAWNVVRYGGSSERRTVKRAEVPDWVVRGAFHLDERIVAVLRTGRLVRVDLDGDGMVTAANARPRRLSPAVATAADAQPDGGRPVAAEDADAELAFSGVAAGPDRGSAPPAREPARHGRSLPPGPPPRW